jgi:protoporphyrinogen IX oxidase
MTSLYLKAVHIIFVVTWFAGLFYMPRLLIYLTESAGKSEPERSILHNQLSLMAQRLWFGITWPSAIITLAMGTALIVNQPQWLQQAFMHVKLTLVFLLYCYHFSLHYLFTRIKNRDFTFSSQQLRVWNEVATLFLISIVFLIVLKNSLSMLWGILGLFVFTVIILLGIKIYRRLRK